jgi:glutathione S-transferase
MKLYAHPFSSYCQKVLVALYENGTPFDFRMLDFGDAQSAAEFAALWPIQRMPVLVDEGRTIVEATIIVEHLDLHHPGRVRFLPADPKEALGVRMLDRIFDNYLQSPMQKIVFDALHGPEARDSRGVAEARKLLDTTYAWLDGELKGREWAAGASFGLADCAAAPALLYADWAHPIGAACANLRAYRERLLARPSYARALDEARPYRKNFPLGDPGRD